MPVRLSTTATDFAQQFQDYLHLAHDAAPDLYSTVRAIIEDVRVRKDQALKEYTTRFDRVDFASTGLRFTSQEIAEGAAACTPAVRAALERAATRIMDYHTRQRPADASFTDAEGVELGWRWSAIDAVGLYVPGGTASYPSSVLMNAIPAKAAGVKRLAMVVPTPDGHINPAVLAAAQIAGVDEIYRIGGAQAVAALAYGTESIAPVSKIVGPGNAYVAEAKRQVFGTVGIDMIAGPTDVVIIADAHANPRWVAADLLAQAEHDTAARATLITPSIALADAVAMEVDELLPTLPRRGIAEQSWEQRGGIFITRDLAEACTLANQLAPEHLELMVEEAETLISSIHAAGAIFVGYHAAEAFGDYLAGPSHVLPTAGTARFSSGLSVFDFLVRHSVIHCTPQALAALGPDGIALAECEGLHAHGLSLSTRLKQQ